MKLIATFLFATVGIIIQDVVTASEAVVTNNNSLRGSSGTGGGGDVAMTTATISTEDHRDLQAATLTQQGGGQYIGCFGAANALRGVSHTISNVIDKNQCITECTNGGYNFAGIYWGGLIASSGSNQFGGFTGSINCLCRLDYNHFNVYSSGGQTYTEVTCP